MRTILNIFGCSHDNITWPLTVKRPERKTYIACLDCGKEYEYDWREMRIVNQVKEEPMFEIGEFRRIARKG